MKVKVEPASPDQRNTLFTLMQYYLHDFTDFEALDADSQGLYQYPYLDFYWQEPDRFPFLILRDDQLAGFALVRRLTDGQSDQSFFELTEFFVLRVFRTQGIGRLAAFDLWNRFVGDWEVRVFNANQTAQPFWKNAIRNYTRGDFDVRREDSPEGKTVYRFRTNGTD